MDTLFFHPRVVHLPIALAILMPLVAAGIGLAWWRNWFPARAWLVVVVLQAVLVGSGIVALQTGEDEEELVETVVSGKLIHEHEEAAELFVWGSGGVLGLMVLALALSRRRAGLPLAGLATLGTVVVLVLGYRTGDAGGDLVYRYGAGSAYGESGP